MQSREIIKIENSTVLIPQSDNIWMTQHQLADLFQCFVGKINANIRAILKTKILDETNTCRTHHYQNGNTIEKYNLEMIIALSFRIKTRNAEIFRKWLTKKLTKADISEMPILIYRSSKDTQTN